MNGLPTLCLKGMSTSRQLIAAARFLPEALEVIRSRRLSIPASFFVAAEGGQMIGISSGDVIFTAPPADLRRIQDMVVALEDRRFHRHRGIDFRGVVRATIANARAQKVVQGASTITQQLVRNTLLAPDRSAIRKVCELRLAIEVERHYSKAEILHLYCHHVFLGNGTRGFPAAAKLLYRRPLGSLDEEQLVALAGLLRTPSQTHPIGGSVAYVKRTAALASVLGIAPSLRNVAPRNPTDSRRLIRSRHTTQIRTELRRLGAGEEDIARVTTSLQPSIQTGLNQALAVAFQSRAVRACAGIVLEVRSSNVVAESSWVEGKESDFSVAFRGRIQPGSTFKSFAALSALEQGFTMRQPLESSPFESTAVGGHAKRPWRVRNYGHVYRGRVTLLEALRTSDNTAFARLTEMLRQDALSETYQRLRLCDRAEVTPAIVLGAHRGGVSLAALANAYATVARYGLYLPYRLVRLVEFRDGSFLRAPRAAGELVLRDYPAVAALRDALVQCGVRYGGAVVSGKTGTTRLGSLFAGYDDRLSYAVWVGFREPVPEGDPKALSAVRVFEGFVRRVFGTPSEALSI